MENKGPGQKKIRVEGLIKDFRVNGNLLRVLDGIDLEIEENRFYCLIGPSGCGKTTILRTIAGLEHPTAGTVDIRMVSSGRNALSYVFQQTLLFPWLTIEGNLRLGLKRLYPDEKTLNGVIDEHLDKVDLGKFKRFYPTQVSGGMQKRAALARALSVGPEVILMDEPFVYLDAQTKNDMHNLMLDLYSHQKCTVLFVTHDIREAIILSSKIIVLSALPSKVKSVIDVPFGYPRTVEDILPTDGFHEVYWKVYNSLKDEVEKSHLKEEKKILEHRFRPDRGMPV